MVISRRGEGGSPLVLAFACFIVQGIANGMLGVAWPSVRNTFAIPLDFLAVLLVCTTIGYVTGSVTAGKIMARVGIGRTLFLSNMLAGIGLMGYAISPGWLFFAATGLLVGWTSGAVGASLNIFIASTGTLRVMNWLHAMYGVGATIGPLVMTAAIASRYGWRIGYGFAASLFFALGLAFIIVMDHMDFRGVADVSENDSEEDSRQPGILAALRVPIVLLGIALFLLYTGVETTTGQWAYSLFTEERSISIYFAGILTSIFWGMLTVGRIVFGAAADRIGITRLLRMSMIGAMISSALFIIPTSLGGLASVTFMGLSLSAIFPTLLSDTPNRVGPRYASVAIGLQTGAASVGLAILPGVAGILAERVGLEILGPYLLLATTAMLITNEVAMRLVRRNRKVVELSTPV